MSEGALNKNIIGLDEAGRGALCGPVVASAVLLKSKTSKIKKLIFGKSKIRDSKKLSPREREAIFKKIKNSSLIFFGTGKVSPKEIDKLNILKATQLAMVRAIKDLLKKVDLKKKLFLILDGKITLPNEIFKKEKIDFKIYQKAKVKADEKVLNCALASIVAKVTRDKIMINYSEKYPKYRLEIHKGYPTKHHLKLLKKYGPSKIYRMSFAPVKVLFKRSCHFLKNP